MNEQYLWAAPGHPPLVSQDVFCDWCHLHRLKAIGAQKLLSTGAAFLFLNARIVGEKGCVMIVGSEHGPKR